ncbi:hypothetical protein DRJ25_06145 [Candidatus Woesearchaeota archaeon]|nr:MAG: hypothetical protein DRJ25_06145 [Candidatus Woesearchaeota archaeon]
MISEPVVKTGDTVDNGGLFLSTTNQNPSNMGSKIKTAQTRFLKKYRSSRSMKKNRLNPKKVNAGWRFIIRPVLVGIKFLPDTVLYLFSEIVGNCAFFLSGNTRRKAIQNLTTVFRHEKSLWEIRKISRQVFCGIARDVVSTGIYSLKKNRRGKALTENVRVEGTEYLDEALKKGKGVICVSAHFGNFMIMTLRLSQMGYACNMIVKDSNIPGEDKIWQHIRTQAGLAWIPARPRFRAAAQALKWLKKGGVLFLYADRNKKGVRVTFFDRPAGFFKGPAVFHLRTGADLLCAFNVRQGRKKHKIIITPPITVQKTGDFDKDIYQITQAYAHVIEKFVREHPEQWWWPHRNMSPKFRR